METKFTLILLMAVTNLSLRLAPVRLIAKRELSPLFVRFLELIPVPILGAMLANEILVREGRITISWSNAFLWAFFPVMLTAYFSRNLYATVIAGMGSVALIRLLTSAF